MQITISFGPGFDVEGVVLSLTGGRLRVAIAAWDDAAEFHCRHGQWFSENRDPVNIAWPNWLRSGSTENVATDRVSSRAARQSCTWVN